MHSYRAFITTQVFHFPCRLDDSVARQLDTLAILLRWVQGPSVARHPIQQAVFAEELRSSANSSKPETERFFLALLP
jgi:hypothetical protein